MVITRTRKPAPLWNVDPVAWEQREILLRPRAAGDADVIDGDAAQGRSSPRMMSVSSGLANRFGPPASADASLTVTKWLAL